MSNTSIQKWSVAGALTVCTMSAFGCLDPNGSESSELPGEFEPVIEAMTLSGYGAPDQVLSFNEINENGRETSVFPVEHAEQGSGVDILVPDGTDPNDPPLVLRPWTTDDVARLNSLATPSPESDSFRAAGKYSTGCNYITKVGFNIGCVNLSSNPFGYYQTRMVRYGYSYSGPPSLVSWYADWQGHIVVCPYEQTSAYSYSVCGAP